MLKKVFEFLVSTCPRAGDAGETTAGNPSTTVEVEDERAAFGCKIKERFRNAVAIAGDEEVNCDLCTGEESLEPTTDDNEPLPHPLFCDMEGDHCGHTFTSISQFRKHLLETHSLFPLKTSRLTLPLVIHAGDLKVVPPIHDDLVLTYSWNPKWIRAHGHDFIFIMTRMAPQGIWSSWVWLLGSAANAKRFKVTLRFVKQDEESLGGEVKYGVLPIGFPRRLIEDSGNCWQVPDEVMRSFSKIGNNVITSEQRNFSDQRTGGTRSSLQSHNFFHKFPLGIQVKVDIEAIDPTVSASPAGEIFSSSSASKNSGCGGGDQGAKTASDAQGASIPLEIAADLEDFD